MAKQKNLSPLELKYLVDYIKDPNRPTLQEISVEMGHDIPVIEKYIESLGGIPDVVKEIPNNQVNLTQEQIAVRQAFASDHKGAVSMTEGASGMIESATGAKSLTNPPQYKDHKSPKSEKAIFRGNKPLNARGNPNDGRRF